MSGQPVAFKLYAITTTSDGYVNYAARENASNAPALWINTTNGSFLQATQSFWVTVTAPPAPVVASWGQINDNWTMTINGAYGPDYTIETATNLTRWTEIFSTNAPQVPFVWTDPNTNRLPQRFYRVKLGP